MVWNKTKAVLKESMGEAVYSLWVEPLECVSADEVEIRLACPDRFYRAHLERTHLSLIQTKVLRTNTTLDYLLKRRLLL